MNQGKEFAVIGSPIGHSLSPDIHLPVLRRFIEGADYHKIEVKKGELPDWIGRVRSVPISGFNVTMPHKTDMIPFLDRLEGDARIFRSVNTVVNRQGQLVGYNTDGEGFHLSLRRKGFVLADSDLLILGAGGVARTLIAKAAMEGARSVRVLARSPEKAEAVIREAKEAIRQAQEISGKALTMTGEKMSKGAPGRNERARTGPGATKGDERFTRLDSGGMEEAADRSKDAQILINATPLGMAGVPGEFADLSFLEGLPEGALVFDLIYNPRETCLLAAAAARGLAVQNGLGMLIYQGLLADRLFLELEFDLEEIYREIELTLEGKVDRL